VSLIDVTPTALAVLGFPPPAGLPGRNLLDPEATHQPRTLYSESFPCPVLHKAECPSGCLSRAVVSWPRKFIASSNGKRELFDLSNDPREERNLAAFERPSAQELASNLSAWIKTMPAQARQKLRVDNDSVQRLKSLGYVQ